MMRKYFSLFIALFIFSISSGCATTQKTHSNPQDVDPELADSRVWYRPEFVDRALRMTDYGIVDSYIFGAVTRPFSYVFRALTLSRDTAYETATQPASFFYPENKVVPPLSKGDGMDLEAFDAYLQGLTRRDPLKGMVHFLIGGDEFFPRLERAINGANQSIDIRLFIFDNDDYGVKIADLLKKKSLEGVKVRVLLDSTGQVIGEGKAPKDLPKGFVQPYSMGNYLKKDSYVHVRLRPDILFRGDHTKTIVIDNKICFTGGINIGREYRYDWHDMMMELHGPVLGEIIYEFKIAWGHAGFWGDFGYVLAKMWKKRPVIHGEGAPIRLLYTRVNNPELYRAQLEAIRRAKKYVWINNAYFSDNEILYELVRARRRGVDVRVILPDRGNHEVMNRSNVVTANILFRNGIKVYFYPGMSHVKAALYDGWLCTGSANFDKLSFHDNLEMDVTTLDKKTVAQLKKQLFEKDFSRSRQMEKPLDSNIANVIAEILAEQL